MESAPEDLAVAEFVALRATIRERGTARLIVGAITFVAWATILTSAWSVLVGSPWLCLATLIALAAGFEAILAAHLGAERVGRYLASRYEPESGRPGWERALAAWPARGDKAPRLRPLFTPLFAAAALVNLTPLAAALAGGRRPAAWMLGGLIAVAHLLWMLRLIRAEAFARRQRVHDALVFEEP